MSPSHQQDDEEGWAARIRRFFTIDFRMIPTKTAYMLFGGILGSHVPYVYMFFTSVGLTDTQAGLITGIRFGPSTISGPLWGMLADFTGRRKMIMILLCCGSAFPMVTMPWIAQWIYPVAYTNQNATYSGVLNNVVAVGDVINSSTGHARTVPVSLFYVLLVAMILSSLFVGPLPGYVDSIVMNVVKTSEYKVNYGAQRIYGSLGFALASFVAGVAADSYKSSHLSKYTAIFYIYLPYCLLLIPIGSYLVGQSRWEKSADNQQKRTNDSVGNTEQRSMTSKMRHMFTKADIWVLVGTVIVSGLACNIFLTFTVKLLKDVTDANDTKISLAFVIATVAEVFMFPFNAKIIVMCRGTSIPLMLGIFSYFVRFLVMSYTDKLCLQLFVQVLHGVGFALHWSAMMEYLHRVTPKEIILTMFLIFQSIQFGAAAVVANVAGGGLYQTYGGKRLFRGKAILCGGWCLIMALYYGGKRFSAYRNRNVGTCTFNSRQEMELTIREARVTSIQGRCDSSWKRNTYRL